MNLQVTLSRREENAKHITQDKEKCEDVKMLLFLFSQFPSAQIFCIHLPGEC